MRVALKTLTLSGLACLALTACGHQDNTSSSPSAPGAPAASPSA